MKNVVSLLFVLLTVSLTGCGNMSPASYKAADTSVEAMTFVPSDGFARAEPPGRAAGGELVSERFMQESGTSADLGDLPRKIIYTASVGLVVENFDGLEQRIRETVKQHQGYLSRSDLDRMQGEQRSGSWTARIPVDQYDDFLKSIASLGVPTSQKENAQDVTEEFVDLTARIENKRKLEQRILELLQRPDDEIKHVLEVERELARVREEIERMDGRIRFLSDQTEMTTVNISAREQRDYRPPQEPTLDNRVSLAWTRSLENTSQFFQDAIVLLVANVLALIAWTIGLLIGWLVIRAVWRKFRGQPTQATSEY